MKKENRRRRVVLYVRVSTKKQTNLNQFLQLRKAAEYHDWEVVAVFRDHGRTGANQDRPGFQALLKFIRNRKNKVDMLATYNLSRIGRSVRDLANFLEDEIRERNINYFSYRDSIDTTTPHGRMLFAILAAVSEFERECTVEKVLDALERARAQGKTLGRPKRNNPKNKKYDPEIINKILTDYNNGKGKKIKQIVKEVPYARNTVRSIIREAENAETEAS